MNIYFCDGNTILHKICKAVLFIKNENGEHGLELYNQLISTDYTFTDDELWSIVDTVGKTEQVFNAIICSKVASSSSMFHLLRLTNFNGRLCWLVFHYYPDQRLHMRIIRAMKERNLPHYEGLLQLSNSMQEIPADDWMQVTETNYQFVSHIPSQYN